MTKLTFATQIPLILLSFVFLLRLFVQFSWSLAMTWCCAEFTGKNTISHIERGAAQTANRIINYDWESVASSAFERERAEQSIARTPTCECVERATSIELPASRHSSTSAYCPHAQWIGAHYANGFYVPTLIGFCHKFVGTFHMPTQQPICSVN